MYWVYILENQSDKSWYIGLTSNLKRRLQEHKGGYGSRTTSLKKNWHIIYCEGYLNKKDAAGREKFLKSGSGRKFLKKQLKHYLNISGVAYNE
jgi:putative endonuclease